MQPYEAAEVLALIGLGQAATVRPSVRLADRSILFPVKDSRTEVDYTTFIDDPRARTFIDDPRARSAPRGYTWRPPGGYAWHAPHNRIIGTGAAADQQSTALTMGAAQALDQALVTNRCNGCSDLKGPLRQLTFAFKAAVLSDPAWQNTPVAMNLNVSTPLAMTGFGPGTNAALSAVLGATRQSESTPCTDALGNCLGGDILTVPPSLQPAVTAATAAVGQLLGQMPNLVQNMPQQDIINLLKAAVDAVLGRLAVWNVQAGQQSPAAAPAPAPVATVTEAKPFPTQAVVVGGLLGVAVLGSIVALVRSGKAR